MISLSLVQLVVNVTVVFGPCPAYLPRHFSCYVPETKTIYLISEYDRMHEYGHAYDFQVMKRADRLKFRRIMGYKPTRRWWDKKYSQNLFKRGDSESPGEQFAENYGACVIGYWWPNYNRFCSQLPKSAYGTWKANLPKQVALNK